MLSYGEIALVVLSAAVGYVGKFLQDWWTARQERERAHREHWSTDQQRFFLPLLGAAQQLDDRLACLTRVYNGEGCGPFTAKGLSQDFRELYMLSDKEIPDLYNLKLVDPNQTRQNPDDAQHVRTRMCRELNFATSSLYQTARYLAFAALTERVLRENGTSLSPPAVAELRRCLRAVTLALQGETGAGLAEEQQSSIAEIMRAGDERVITQYEFRKRLLEVPGWEQFTALLTFFITEDDNWEGRPDAARFAAKLNYEMRATRQALGTLVEALKRLTMLADPRLYRQRERAAGKDRHSTSPRRRGFIAS